MKEPRLKQLLNDDEVYNVIVNIQDAFFVLVKCDIGALPELAETIVLSLERVFAARLVQRTVAQIMSSLLPNSDLN